MIAALLALLGGLGLLLFGLRSISEALQVLAGDYLRRRVAGVGEGRRAQFETGVIAGLITQSAAAAVVHIVGFVNAGLMTLSQAAGVLAGTNLGAVTAAWLLALHPGALAVGVLGAGAIVHLLAEREAVRFAGTLTMAIGMLYVALRWMTDAWLGIGPQELPAWLLRPETAGAGALLAGVALAALVTVLLQAATATIGIVIALAAAAALSLPGAIALVVGANLGGCATVLRAAAPATADSRRTALIHTLLNAAAAIALLAGLPATREALALVPPGAGDTAGPAHVALAHTLFNAVLALLAVPLLPPLRHLAERVVGPAARERTGLRYLRQSVVDAPALAIEQCRLEVLAMAALTLDALQQTRQLFAGMDAPQAEVRRRILAREKATDAAQHEVTVFLSRVLTGTLSAAQSDECRALIRAADEIESIADYCERLANYRRRMLRENVSLDAAGLRDLQAYLERTVAFLEDIVDRIRRQETGWLQAVATKSQYLAADADALRDANLQRLAAQKYSPAAGIFFNDMLVAMRRIRNHAVNLAEAYLGKK